MELELISPSTNLSLGSSVYLGQGGKILTWGRNDMATTQQMGIHWVVKDPDGGVVIDRTEWELIPYTSPGDAHGFIGPTFVLDKAGIWTVTVELLMNRPSPVVVDTYDGDLCTVTTEIPPEYELIQHTIYHFAYIYDGDVEVTTVTFKTDPFSPSAWMGEQFAKKLEDEYRARGGNVLEVRVYVDVTPLLWTDYRIELIGTPLGEEVAAPGIGVAGIPIAISVLIIALAIIAVIVIATLMWERFMDTFKPYPGLKDVKPGWHKEALILDIHDSEEKWERTITPIETLEGMSEEELRVLLDKIAEEEVPTKPEIPWELLAIVGGLGVLGVGAAVALAARPKG